MDFERFLNAKLTPREESIEVPELAEWFGKDAPVWVVRGLSAPELGRVNHSSDTRAETLKSLISAMAGDGDKGGELRKAMGLSDEDVPQDVSRRIEMLTIGSVSPVLGADRRDVAVRLAETFPTVFYNLTNHITNLTGKGCELGKPKPSGKTKA